MNDVSQLDKIVSGLQEALAFLKGEITKTQMATKKVLNLEQQAKEAIDAANQRVIECAQREAQYQRQQEDLAVRENKIVRYEAFEAQVIALERDRAELSNARTAFNTEVRCKRDELNAKAEEILNARKELDYQRKQMDQERKTMRQEIIQSLLNKEL